MLEHVRKFPEGQFVAVSETGDVVASCSNCLVVEATWKKHGSWVATVGGPNIEGHDDSGSTLYGLDIAVHPAWRRAGIGRALYAARFGVVRARALTRYGTGCRIPDFREAKRQVPHLIPAAYAEEVVRGARQDRTLSPLLRFGLTFLGVVNNYMEDDESANAAALLEWKP